MSYSLSDLDVALRVFNDEALQPQLQVDLSRFGDPTASIERVRKALEMRRVDFAVHVGIDAYLFARRLGDL